MGTARRHDEACSGRVGNWWESGKKIVRAGLSLTTHIVYSGAGRPYPPLAVIIPLPPEFIHDVNPVRHQERISKQTAQHIDCVQHCVFAAAAPADDDDLARVLSRSGERRICGTADREASRVSHVLVARLLPREDSRDSGG